MAGSSRRRVTGCWSSSAVSSMRCGVRPRCRPAWHSAMWRPLRTSASSSGSALTWATSWSRRATSSGMVCVSARVQEDAAGKLELTFEDLGEKALKNIARPIRAYRIATGAVSAGAQETPAALTLPDKPSIAVLPFANMSGDPEQEYFADGMVEEITTAISRLPWLFVIARNSSFTYKGKAVDVKQVARDLGVRYVLEGSVRKGGSRVRVTGQLIDTTTGAHIWADRFDGALDDI